SIGIIERGYGNIDFAWLMTHMNRERRGAVAAIAAFAEGGRGEAADSVRAALDMVASASDSREYHPPRPRNLLANPAVAPTRVIGFLVDPIANSAAGTAPKLRRARPFWGHCFTSCLAAELSPIIASSANASLTAAASLSLLKKAHIGRPACACLMSQSLQPRSALSL